MEIVILTGGPISYVPEECFQNHNHKQYCGVDYGSMELIKHGINPFLSIGDFDSTSNSDLLKVKRQSDHFIYRPLKDDITDTELAFKYLIEHYNFDRFKIYGATGGRLDQLFSNIFFILNPHYNNYVERLELIDKFNQVNFYLPGNHIIYRNFKMKYLAFVPLCPVRGLELLDEKYTLSRSNFYYPVSLSSNEFLHETAKFIFESGIIMVIQSKDKSTL